MYMHRTQSQQLSIFCFTSHAAGSKFYTDISNSYAKVTAKSTEIRQQVM